MAEDGVSQKEVISRRTFFKRLGMLAALPIAAKIPATLAGRAGCGKLGFVATEEYLEDLSLCETSHSDYSKTYGSFTVTNDLNEKNLDRAIALAKSVKITQERVTAIAFNKTFFRI